MKPEVFTVTANIKANEKRMAKINRFRNIRDRRDQARKFVIAECQAQKFRATEDEIVAMTVRITG